MYNRREIGSIYEKKAEEFLTEQGIRILDRNFRMRSGELDLVGMDENAYLVFIEVKYRKNKALGSALEAVNPRKARQVRRMAERYLYSKGYIDADIRFDVIAVEGDEIIWIKDAF